MHPLIPLVIVLIMLLVAAAVGFVIYTVATDIATHTSKKMEDHNLNLGKDGLKIGVREVRNEDYVGRTQDVLVRAWNLSTWPAYKSRFWNKDAAAGASGASASASGSGSGKGARAPRGVSPGAASRASAREAGRGAAAAHRTENGRLAEPRPTVRRSASGTAIPGSFD